MKQSYVPLTSIIGAYLPVGRLTIFYLSPFNHPSMSFTCSSARPVIGEGVCLQIRIYTP